MNPGETARARSANSDRAAPGLGGVRGAMPPALCQGSPVGDEDAHIQAGRQEIWDRWRRVEEVLKVIQHEQDVALLNGHRQMLDDGPGIVTMDREPLGDAVRDKRRVWTGCQADEVRQLEGRCEGCGGWEGHTGRVHTG